MLTPELNTFLDQVAETAANQPSVAIRMIRNYQIKQNNPPPELKPAPAKRELVPADAEAPTPVNPERELLKARQQEPDLSAHPAVVAKVEAEQLAAKEAAEKEAAKQAAIEAKKGSTPAAVPSAPATAEEIKALEAAQAKHEAELKAKADADAKKSAEEKPAAGKTK